MGRPRWKGLELQAPWGIWGHHRDYYPTRLGWAIDSIQFQSNDLLVNVDNSVKFGGEGGDRRDRTDKIILDWPREYLCSISGTYGPFEGYVVLTSLEFHTNRIKYGPYGRKGDNAFSFPMEGGAIISLYGRSGWLIDSIGAYAVPLGPVCASIRLFDSRHDDNKGGDNQQRKIQIILIW